MQLLRHFLTDRRGGTAPFLAIAAVPLLAAIGAGVDYGRVNAARTAMQAALDSTALTLSKTAQTMSETQIAASAQQVFSAVFDRPEVRDASVAVQFQSPQQGSFSLMLTGTGTVDTMFGGILGTPAVNFQAQSTVLWGIKKLNLALALDNTGSMAQSGKMTALKNAAHNLLNTLQTAAKTPGDVVVSIIPFAVDVNVDTANVGADWVDWTDWDAANGTCSKSSYKTQSSCTSSMGTWTPKSHSTWNGCVNDRDQNNDVLNTPTGTTAATKFRAHQASACPVAMMPLSYDWSALHNKIDAMTPTGNTNVTIGLAHAWQTLSPVAPWNAPPPAPDLDKVIVLLTDGTNTQNRWTTSVTSIDARTQKVCDNIKADNVRIYTVRVIDGNVSLLKNCATNPDMYYDVQNADQLAGVFGSIAQNLANLRIAR